MKELSLITMPLRLKSNTSKDKFKKLLWLRNQFKGLMKEFNISLFKHKLFIIQKGRIMLLLLLNIELNTLELLMDIIKFKEEPIQLLKEEPTLLLKEEPTQLLKEELILLKEQLIPQLNMSVEEVELKLHQQDMDLAILLELRLQLGMLVLQLQQLLLTRQEEIP